MLHTKKSSINFYLNIFFLKWIFFVGSLCYKINFNHRSKNSLPLPSHNKSQLRSKIFFIFSPLHQRKEFPYNSKIELMKIFSTSLQIF